MQAIMNPFGIRSSTELSEPISAHSLFHKIQLSATDNTHQLMNGGCPRFLRRGGYDLGYHNCSLFPVLCSLFSVP
jgi:hypothetical protein